MYRVLNTDNAQNTMTIQGAYSHNSNVDICRVLFQNYDADSAKTYDMASIGMQDQWGNSNMDGYGNLIFRTGSNERMRIQYDGKIGIGTSHANAMLDIAAGNILAKNLQKITKTTDTSNPLNIMINWENEYTMSNRYNFVFETVQEISNGNLLGCKISRHGISLSNQRISWDSPGEVYGDDTAYSTLSLDIVSSTTKSILMRSSTNWSTTGDMSHSFTTNILQSPDTSNIGNVWLS